MAYKATLIKPVYPGFFFTFYLHSNTLYYSMYILYFNYKEYKGGIEMSNIDGLYNVSELCRTCKGTGDLVHLIPDDPTSGRYMGCPVCKGTGLNIYLVDESVVTSILGRGRQDC